MKSTNKAALPLLLYAYSVLLGAAYLLAFWRPFGFDIFPYLSTIDFLTSPLNRISVLLAPLMMLLVITVADRSISIKQFPRRVFLAAIVTQISLALAELFQGISVFLQSSFYFENEKSVMALCGIFVFLSIAVAFKATREAGQTDLQLLAIAFAQIATVMASGYDDGKKIFNGADNVYFLEDKTLCENPPLRDWVYLGRFGSQAIFFNTIDKRICLRDKIQFNLISRKFSEGL